LAVTPKPKRQQSAVQSTQNERAADTFITRAGGTTPASDHERKGKRNPITLRFNPDLLKKVDTAAKRRGISRTAWIQFVVSRALDQGDG